MDPRVLFQVLYRPIFVPIKPGEGGEPSPAVFNISDRNLVLGFSSALSLAMMCGEGIEFIELPAKTLFPDLTAAGLDFGYNFGQEDALLYGADQLDDLLLEMEKDQIIDVPEKLEYLSTEISDAFRDALADRAPHDDVIQVVREKSLGLLICVSQKELDAHMSLLSQLHDVAVSMENEETVTLMPYKSADDLGSNFEEFAITVNPKPDTKADQPPILR